VRIISEIGLELSGVGDPEHLGPIGVPVAHELRGVGNNMQDHYTARVSYPVVGAQTANERSRGLPLAGGAAKPGGVEAVDQKDAYVYNRVTQDIMMVA
jgi:choline dehydrogenase-like flavoprotein